MAPQIKNGLRNAVSASFIARTWYSGHDLGSKLRDELIPGQAFDVRVRRPGSVYIAENRTDPVMEEARTKAGTFCGNPFDLFVSDGERQYELASASHVYFAGPAASKLVHIKSKRGLPESLSIPFLFNKRMHAWFDHRQEAIGDGRQAVCLDGGWDDSSPARNDRLWLDSITGLPMYLSEYEHSNEDEPVELRRIDYSDWELNLKISDSVFDPTPPADSKPAPEPEPWHDPKLRRGMLPAPLDTVDLHGETISLSQYAGRVVLLDYWAIWCQPCCDEMVGMKALYEQLHDRGLEIIGVSLDKKQEQQRMEQFLVEQQIPWRQLCDGQGFDSPLATAYKIGAVPFTLLIGRDGKIAAVNKHGEDLEEAVRQALDT